MHRLADLVPPPRKHRHRYYGVFAPNHRLRKAVTALAIGNVSKQRETTTGGDGNDGHATGGCCDANHATLKPRSHDTSRIAWAKLMARVGEEFPLECPKPRPTSCPRSTSTASERYRPQAAEASGLASRSSAGRPLLKCHWPGYPSLTGQPFTLLNGWRSAPRRTGESGPRSGFDTGYPARPPSAGCQRGRDRIAGY